MALEQIEMREMYQNKLLEMAEKDERIVVLDADLMKASKALSFRAAMPERSVDVGVAEANMIGVAAGLAASGKIPFTHSFTPFATRRCYDQVAISVAYSKLPLKMLGTDPGVSAEMNGGTHMSFEDMGIMRNLPGMTVFEPVDAAMVAAAMEQVKDHEGPVYTRLFRKKAEGIFDENLKFELGKGILMEEGTDVTIFATGIMVKESIEAVRLLKEEGINARLINIHTLKPLDEAIVIKAAQETGAVVTAENHNIINGLGSAVAECLVENCPVPMKRIGVKDCFGEVGKMPFLMEKFEMLPKDIVAACKEVIAKK